MEDVPEPVGPRNSPEVEADEMLTDQRREDGGKGTVLRLLAEIAEGQNTILRSLQGENTTASRKAGRPLSFLVLLSFAAVKINKTYLFIFCFHQ
jgi:hypothetical protein